MPLAVQFTDTSTGSPTSWNWSFGDGSISSAQSPVHIYSSAGTYSVSLTAINGNGSNSTTRAGYITGNFYNPTGSQLHGECYVWNFASRRKVYRHFKFQSEFMGMDFCQCYGE